MDTAPDEAVPLDVLVVSPIVDVAIETIAAGCRVLDRRSFDVEGVTAGLTPSEAQSVAAILTSGAIGLTAAQMDRMPNLRLASSFGIGHENIDLDAARARGIAVTNAPATNDRTVADHAIGLMIAAAREFATVDAEVRAGRWLEARKTYRPTLNGARVGILGMGNIGGMIATRAAAFDAEIAYTNRQPREGSPWRFEPDLLALAGWADFLVVATPGGAATRHLINAAVLDALGPMGTLVNIGRGSTVDSEALAAALHDGRLHAAGLDVVEDEPQVPPCLLAAPRLLITPHIAGRAPVALQAQASRFLDNVRRLHRGEPLVSRLV